MNSEVKQLTLQLETVTDEEQACIITRDVIQYMKSRPADIVILSEASIKNCSKILRQTVNYKLRCLIFAVLAACCSDAETVKRFLRNDIQKPLLRTLQHLIKTPWGDGGSKHVCQEEILLNQAVTLLQKMAANIDIVKDPGSMDELIRDGVINRLVDLLDDGNSPLFQYSALAKQTLENLILRKNLVGQVAPWEEKSVREICEKFIRGSSKLPLSCCKNGKKMMHLYDTTSPDVEIDVRKELVDSGSVWHTDSDTFETEKGEGEDETAKLLEAKDMLEWVDVHPVHVEDGGHFWAHIGGQDTLKTVETLEKNLAALPASGREYLRRAPPVGSFVCAVTEKGRDEPLYFRGVVMAVDGETVTVIALDYGFRCQLPFKDLSYLSGRMNVGGVPPQATLCALQEVQPCPVSIQCVKSILAVLSFILAYPPSVSPFTKEGGLQVLYNLCSAPDLAVSCMAVANISNIARLSFMRKKLAETKFLHLFIRRCEGINPRSPDHVQIELLRMTLGAIKNLLFNMLEVRNKFLELGGVAVLMTIAKKADSKTVKDGALGGMKVLLGGGCYEEQLKEEDLIPMAPMLMEDDPQVDKKPDSRSRTDRRRSSSVKSRSTSRPRRGREASLGRDRWKDSSSDEEIPNRSGGRRFSVEEADNDMNDRIISSKLRASTVASTSEDVIHVGVNAALTSSADVSFYIRGRKVKFSNDMTHEIRPTQLLRNASRTTIKKIICSFLNNGEEASIFYGIGKDREVFGIPSTRDENDEFRLGIDRLMTDFIPVVFHGRYAMTFSPVVDDIGHGDPATRRYVPNRHVIEIILKKQTSTVYTLSDGTCFFRYGANTVPVSTQEIRQRAIFQEEARYRDEIDSLKLVLRELLLLKQANGE